MHRVPAHHVADSQLYAVLLAGRQHGPSLAQADGHGLLAEDGARRTARGGKNGLRGVPARWRCDAEQVGLLLVQHPLEVAVTAQVRELAADAVKRGWIDVADRGQLDVLELQVGPHVLESSPIQANHGGPLRSRRHR